jgi:hypothetical protein
MKLTQSDRDFYGGVICALAVVHYAGEETIYDEIVQSVGGRAKLLAVARREGNMRWSGLDKHLKREAARQQYRRREPEGSRR